MTKLTPRLEVQGWTQRIKEKALELGFNKVGMRRVERLDDRNRLEEWLAEGNHGEMQWMARDSERRLDPSRVLAQARSIITLGVNYYTPIVHSESSLHGKVSRYAWGKDYHLVLKDRLNRLADWILDTSPASWGLAYCDTGPIMEKAWAQLSGMGWIGKHSNLITQELGSWLFLAEILTQLELESNQESKNHCGICHRCIDVCLTRAIVAPYVVDARRCISYLTIELRGPIPREFRASIGTRIFGCDDCQDVCPWNRFSQPSQDSEFYPDQDNYAPALAQLIGLTELQFQERFRHSPIRRAGYRGFLRNVAVALGNSADPRSIPALQEAVGHPEPLVRQHAAWALGKIGGTAAKALLAKALQCERDVVTREEIELALRTAEEPL